MNLYFRLRHREDKHNNEEVNFEMKVICSHQHDALARQCAEAIRIKEIEPQKRIYNKEEYHQPGDVEINYTKMIEKIKQYSKIKIHKNIMNQKHPTKTKIQKKINKNREELQNFLSKVLGKNARQMMKKIQR